MNEYDPLVCGIDRHVCGDRLTEVIRCRCFRASVYDKELETRRDYNISR